MVQLVLRTVLKASKKAYKVMRECRTAAVQIWRTGSHRLRYAADACLFGSQNSMHARRPAAVLIWWPGCRTPPMHDFIGLQNGAQNELHHFLCLQK